MNIMRSFTKGAVEAALCFVSKDKYREILTGIHSDGEHIYATDSWKAIRIKTTSAPADAGEAVTLDSSVLALAAKSASKTNPEVRCASVKYGELVFEAGAMLAKSRAIDGTYPDIERLLADNSSDAAATIAFAPDRLLEVCHAAKKLGAPAIRLHVVSGNKAARFEFISGEEVFADGLLMPVADRGGAR